MIGLSTRTEEMIEQREAARKFVESQNPRNTIMRGRVGSRLGPRNRSARWGRHRGLRETLRLEARRDGLLLHQVMGNKQKLSAMMKRKALQRFKKSSSVKVEKGRLGFEPKS